MENNRNVGHNTVGVADFGKLHYWFVYWGAGVYYEDPAILYAREGVV